MGYYQTQKVTPQNGHVEQGCWRLSHAKSEYKDWCDYPEDACSGTTANCTTWGQFLAISPKSPSWKYIRIKCLDIPLHPFKYLKWHKGKKHRHHRLSLLPRGLLATRPVVIFNVVLRTPLKYGVVGFCALLHIAAGGGKSLTAHRRIAGTI